MTFIGIVGQQCNNPSSINFLNTLQDNFLLQYVDIPTRGRGLDVPRILDLVISKMEIVTSLEYLAPLGKSDHTIIVELTLIYKKIKGLSSLDKIITKVNMKNTKY